MLTARPATESDLPYVLNSFVQEYKRSPYADGLTRSQVRALLVAILQKADWACSILCESEIPDEILSFIVWKSPTEIAWLSTKGLFRHKGLAHQMLTAIGATPGRIKTTFLPTPAFSRSVRAKGWTLLHRPYLGVL